jgi:protein-tyrosine phosphatase
MAEALLRRLLEEAEIPAEVRSAGTLSWTGGPAHPDAVAAAADIGLDLSGHEARPLTQDIVRWADIVIGMQRSHVARVRELDSTADVRLITELDPEAPSRDGVEDPIGRSRSVYVDVLDEIRHYLEGFAASLGRTSPAS